MDQEALLVLESSAQEPVLEIKKIFLPDYRPGLLADGDIVGCDALGSY